MQILEVAIQFHTSALTAFNDLKGSELLIERLNWEVLDIGNYKKVMDEVYVEEERKMDDDDDGGDDDYGEGAESDDEEAAELRAAMAMSVEVEVEVKEEENEEDNVVSTLSSSSSSSSSTTPIKPLTAAKRVILFNIFNALMMVFHHSSSQTSNGTGVTLRSGCLPHVINTILINTKVYGGVLTR